MSDRFDPLKQRPPGFESGWLARRVALARAVLMWERLWPALWPAVGIAGIALAIALFDILPVLPGWLHAAALAVLALACGRAIWLGVARIRRPSNADALRRLEDDGGLSHRPLTTMLDQPALGVGDAEGARLWKAHVARAAAAARRVRLRAPHPGLAARDPRALRFAVVLALVVGVFAAGGDAWLRLARAVSPDLSGLSDTVPASLEVWVTPPEYTGQPPHLLTAAPAAADGAPAGDDRQAADMRVSVPVGSRLLAQVNGGRGTPDLLLSERETALERVDETAWRHETVLDTPGPLLAIVEQSGDTLGAWPIEVLPDTPPMVGFAEPPDASQRNLLRLAYEVEDDHGVKRVTAQLVRPAEQARPDDEPLVIDLPSPLPDPSQGAASSSHDLTAHPWAGLEVEVRFEAVDGAGQTGRSDPLSVILPEREFNHPVAREIIAQRRVLALSPESRMDVARSLDGIARQPGRYDQDTVVFLALMSARSRLVHEPEDASTGPVLSLLWDTALRLEDGALSLAEQEISRLQEELRQAIEQDAPDEEIQALMDELRAAMDRFLEALAENLAQQLEGMDLSALPEASEDMQALNREMIEDMMQQLEDMARLGDKEAARRMLEQMRQMMQALQNAPENLRQQQARSPAQEMLRELQDLVRRQQDLHDRTFREQQEGAPQGEEERRMSAEEQEELRRQLGEMMQRLGEMTGEVPENLGDAEQAMREAQDALGEGQGQAALDAQSRALDALRQGGQQMAMQFMRQPGPGQQGPAEGMAVPNQERFDPLGRPFEQDLEDQSEGQVESGRMQGDGVGEASKALRIQDELRRRLRDPNRSEEEIEYLRRLLRRF